MEISNQDIGFSFVLKLRVAPAPEDLEEPLKKRLNLAAASKYGLIFVACKDGMYSQSVNRNFISFFCRIKDIRCNIFSFEV